MYEVTAYDNKYGDYLCQYILKTEEEAKKLSDVMEKYFNDDENIEVYYNSLIIVSDVDSIIENFTEKQKVKDEERIEELCENIADSLKAIKELIRVRSFLNGYLCDADDFIKLIPLMYENLLGTALPITLYDGRNIYTYNGIEEAKGERISYAPVLVNVKSPIAWGYQYQNGKYDIDDDITKLKKAIDEWKEELKNIYQTYEEK